MSQQYVFKLFVFIFGLLVSSFLIGCGNNGSSSSSGAIQPNTATFVDRLTEGLPYDCGGKIGVTDDNGSLNTIQGKGCTFTLGNFSFFVPASIIDKGIVTPYHVSPTKEQVYNLAYILHAVSEYNSDYTMKINQNLAAKLPDINLSSSQQEIDMKLFSVGIKPKPYTMVIKDLARFVNADGSTIYSREELIKLTNEQYVRKFPTVAKTFNMTEKQFRVYMGDDTQALTNSNSQPITQDNIKNMSLASNIKQSSSTFSQYPIFSIGALNNDGLISNNQAGSTSVSTISVTANQSASSHTDQMSLDFKAAEKCLGFKSSQSYHQENKYSDTKDSGSTNLGMTYSTQGAYVQIQTTNMDDYLDLSSYLSGTPLSQSQIDSLVGSIQAKYVIQPATATEPEISVAYIGDLNITNGGVISYAQSNVWYQNIQLLNKMETIYSQLNYQYNNPGTTDTNASVYIKNKTLALMISLKSYINSAIQAFYAHAGESFVDTINVMNMATGNGSLNFTTASGNRESQYAATLSASYSELTFGGSVQASGQYQEQNGWASSFSQTNITAQSMPSGVVDTNAWAQSILNMLKSATTTLTVPGVTLVQQPTLSTISADTAKDPKTPPDSCFKSYDDWNKYQESKKSEQDKEEQAANGIQNAIDKNGLNDENFGDDLELGSSPINLQALSSELKSMNSLKQAKQGKISSILGAGPNSLTVQNMFVSGFSATPYSAVIPQLRPNLTLPTGDDTTLSGFPNVSKLMVFVTEYGKLDTYLNFISQYSFSGLQNTNIASQYHDAYTAFAGNANNVISLALSNGTDLTQDVAQGVLDGFLKQTMDTDTLMSHLSANLDAYNYITKTLTSASNQAIWKNAPGGYAPIIFGSDYSGHQYDGNMQLYMPQGTYDYNPNWGALIQNQYSYEDTKFNDPSYDILQIYQKINAKHNANVSPWFPVFQYRQNQPSNLVFFQLVGPYYIVYAKGYTNIPYNAYNAYSTVVSYSNISPFNQQMDISANANIILSDSKYGFSATSWNYSLQFPNTTSSEVLLEKYNVLVVEDDYSDVNSTRPNSGGYCMVPNSTVFDDIAPYKVSQINLVDSASGSYTTNFCNQIISYNGSSSCGYRNSNGKITLPPWFLLPINATTSPMFASSPNAFSYTLNKSSSSYVLQDYFTAAYNNMLANSK